MHEGTETLVADILTKPLGPDKFKRLPPSWRPGKVFPGGGSSLEDEPDDQDRPGSFKKCVRVR